ncbi:MAG: LamG domain-containing protein, partial [Planctomycetes bacterium]|nr:LamG domain-containing protein [Planctomycetota bacterium]
MSRKVTVVITLALVGLFGTTGFAQLVDANWTAADGTDPNLWNVAANWDSNAVPDANTNAIFGNVSSPPSMAVDLGGALGGTANRVDFVAGGYTISNGTLSLVSGLRNLAGENTISASVTGTALNISVQSGRLNLTGDNSGVAGGTATVASGATLSLSHSSGLGSASISLTGGTLELAGQVVAGAPTDGLQGYWSFNGSFDDDSGNGRNGTGTGVTLVGGKYGQAAQFNGTGQVTITGYKGILGTTARTVSAWVKTTVDNGGIASWGTNASTNKWVFRVQTSNGQAGAIRTEVNGGYKVGSTDIRDDQWHHVTAVLPAGSNNVNQVLLYVDGVLEGTSAVQGHGLSTTSGIDMMLGNDHNNNHFNGLMDEVYLYDRALDANEIQQVMNSSGLTGYEGPLTFNEDIAVSGTGSRIVIDTLPHVDAANLAMAAASDLAIDGNIGFQSTAMAAGASLAANATVDGGAVTMADGTAIAGTGSFHGGSLALADGVGISLAGATFDSTTVSGSAGRSVTVTVPAGANSGLGALDDEGKALTLNKAGDGLLKIGGGASLAGSTLNVGAGVLAMDGNNVAINAATTAHVQPGAV